MSDVAPDCSTRIRLALDDVTQQTGHVVNTSVCHWRESVQTGSRTHDDHVTLPATRGDRLSECLAGVDADGRLILFERRPERPWLAHDLSAVLNRRFAQIVPTHANLSGPESLAAHAVEKRAAQLPTLVLPDPDGHLMFCQRQADQTWTACDVTAHSQFRIDPGCRPVAWQQWSGTGSLIHLLAVDAQGQLLAFHRDDTLSWHGHPTGASCGAGSLSGAGGRSDIGHVAFSISADGRLMQHRRSCEGEDRSRWTHSPLSSAHVSRLRNRSTAACLHHGRIHVFACDVFGSVLQFRQPLSSVDEADWTMTDVTAQTGCRIRQIGSLMQPAAFDEDTQAMSDTLILTASGQGRACVFWWTPEERWQTLDLRESLGVASRIPPGLGQTVAGRESLSLISEGHLLVYEGLQQLRQVSRRLLGIDGGHSIPVFSRRYRLSCRVLACRDSGLQAPELRSIGEAVFGSRTRQRNATSYMDYVSGGAFVLQREDVQGWFTEAELRAAIDQVDIDGHRQLDEHPHERVRQRVQHAIHEDASAALPRTSSGSPAHSDCVESHRRLAIIARVGVLPLSTNETHGLCWRIDERVDVVSLVQSILNRVLCLPRLEPDESDYDLMALRPRTSGHTPFLHPNGVWKYLMGWVRARIVYRAQHYRLRAVADSREVIVIHRQASVPLEYFLLENRQRRPMDDVELPGLLVWHVMQRSGVRKSPMAAPEDSEQPGLPCPVRVRLAAAFTDDNRSGSALTWADGSDSGYTLCNISASDDVMSFDLQLAVCEDV